MTLSMWAIAAALWLVLGTVCYGWAWDGDPETRDQCWEHMPPRWRTVGALALIPVAPVLLAFLALGRCLPALVAPLGLWAARVVIEQEDEVMIPYCPQCRGTHYPTSPCPFQELNRDLQDGEIDDGL